MDPTIKSVGGIGGKYVRRKVAELASDPANVRKHNEKNLDAIKASPTRFGQQKPIVIDKSGVVRAGNGTLAAAKALGWAEIDCVETELEGAEATAYAIADNRTAELAEWDEAALTAVLQSLEHEDAALLEAAGFDQRELDKLMAQNAGEVIEDEAPEPPADPVTKPGDLWLLGEHRLLCGDSTKAEDVARAMDGQKAALCLTDPPYGVDYVGKTKDALPVRNDGRDTLLPLLTASLGLVVTQTRPGACWYVAAPAGPQFYDFATVLRDLGVWRQTLVWAKQSLVMGHSDYHYQHESIFYGWTPGASHKPPPDRKQTTMWSFDRPTASREHPTMKPVALFARAVENSSTVGSLVIDPFLGSGTTLIAAEQLGRKCYGLEIDPGYCDVIVARWEKLTGKKAQRVPA